MNLYEISSVEGSLILSKRIEPIRFKTVNGNSKEQDLEDLIILHPGLLNTGDFLPRFDRSEDSDLLVIGRQPRTTSAKRADLFAIHRDGSLVVIEIKRDAEDERNRREAMEFQAIRYAAASRKMTADSVIDMFANYLSIVERKSPVQDNTSQSLDMQAIREKAIDLLCNHLADEEEDLTKEDIDERINPRKKQRIYLVAAGFEPDVVSACAWLREHDIPIYCFQLRPYRIGNIEVLDRHRLIPPPVLDEYLLEMVALSSDERLGERALVRQRTATDKPRRLVFSKEDGQDVVYEVNSWKSALLHSIRHLIEIEKIESSLLDMPTNRNTEDHPLRNPETVSEGLQIETNASSRTILDWLDRTLLGIEYLALKIETNSGAVHELPRDI